MRVSEGVAIRIISMRLRRLYRPLSYPIGSSGDFLRRIHGFMPLAYTASLNHGRRSQDGRAAIVPLAARPAARLHGTVADLPGHEEAERSPIRISDRVQLGVRAAFVRPIRR